MFLDGQISDSPDTAEASKASSFPHKARDAKAFARVTSWFQGTSLLIHRGRRRILALAAKPEMLGAREGPPKFLSPSLTLISHEEQH